MAATADLATLKLDQFSSHLNTAFEMLTPDGKKVSLTLAEAIAKGSPHPKALQGTQNEKLKARDGGSFSLHFVGPEARWPQGIYPLTHPKLGAMNIFLVPTGPTAGGFGYNAVFG
jgi:hypothetical protein